MAECRGNVADPRLKAFHVQYEGFQKWFKKQFCLKGPASIPSSLSVLLRCPIFNKKNKILRLIPPPPNEIFLCKISINEINDVQHFV